jgi:hypothetical protein
MSVAMPRATNRCRTFFVWTAIALAVAVLWGFAPTLFLRAFITTRDLSGLLLLHGFVFTGWIALFIVQTTLIARHRSDIHRALGVVGVGVGVAVVAIGIAVGMAGWGPARRAAWEATDGPVASFAFLAMSNPGNPMLFGMFVAGAVWWRRQRETHKRLMLLACLAIMDAAMARLLDDVGWPIALTPRGFVGDNNVYQVLSPLISPAGFENLNVLPFFIALVLYDRVKIGRVHAATVYGGLILFLFQPFFGAVSMYLVD